MRLVVLSLVFMRILALETNSGVLLKRFVVESEKILLAATSHWLVFAIPFLLSSFLMFAYVGVLFSILLSFSVSVALTSLFIWSISYFFLVANAFIRWKYNLLIVTTEQIIVVIQRSFFYNAITPTTMENIASVRVETQFLGFFNVGIVYLGLKERIEASTREVNMPFIPRPGEVASVIENAIVLAKQRAQGEDTRQEQQEQFRKVREEAPPTG